MIQSYVELKTIDPKELPYAITEAIIPIAEFNDFNSYLIAHGCKLSKIELTTTTAKLSWEKADEYYIDNYVENNAYRIADCILDELSNVSEVEITKDTTWDDIEDMCKEHGVDIDEIRYGNVNNFNNLDEMLNFLARNHYDLDISDIQIGEISNLYFVCEDYISNETKDADILEQIKEIKGANNAK